MITTHPLNKLVRWGFTQHGLAWRTSLAGGDSYYQNDAGVFPTAGFSAPTSAEVHLLRVPGLDPLDIPAEELAAEQALGRTWQNYALLSGGTFMLAGRELYGWIYCAPDGARWLVKTAFTENGYDSFNATSAYGVDLSFTRFGEFGGEAQTGSVSVSLADHGQPITGLGSDPINYVMVASISSDGSKVILALFGARSVSVITAPQGFLLLQLAGDGPNITASLSVLKTRAQTLGIPEPGAVTVQKRRVRWRFDISEGDTAYTLTPAGLETDQPGGSLAYQQTVIIDSQHVSAKHLGQVVAIVFDEFDSQVVLTLDRQVEYYTQYGEPTVTEQTGTLVSVGKPAYGGWTDGEARIAVRQQRDHWRRFSMTLKRDSEALWTNALSWRSVGQMERSYVTNSPYVGNFNQPHYIWLFQDGEPGSNGYATMVNSLELHDGEQVSATDQVSMLLPATHDLYNELVGNDLRQMALSPWPTTAWRLSCRRLSHQVISLHRAPPTEAVSYPVSARYSCMAAAGAEVNDEPSTPTEISRSASYEPVRREVASRADGLTACWI